MAEAPNKVNFAPHQLEYLRKKGYGRPKTAYPHDMPYAKIIALEAQESVLQHMEMNLGAVFNNREL